MSNFTKSFTPASTFLPNKKAGYFQKRARRNVITFLLMAAPALIWFLTMVGWPTIDMFFISLFRWNGGILQPKTFAWFSNYIELFKSTDFFHAVGISVVQVLVTLPLTMIPAFALGYYLTLRRPGYRALRIIFFSPALISTAVRAMMFYGIFIPDGLLNGLLRLIGLSQFTHLWMGEPQTALFSVILIDIWGGIGYNGVLLFTFLSSISKELYEAAELDGAGPWALMWRIAFPLSLEFFGILTMLEFLWVVMGTAGIILLLTKGGPGTASTTLGYLMYDMAFHTRLLGKSQAIAVILFIVGMAAMLLIRRLTRKQYD
ncbi:MAG: sugar ABC transporter permease [Anaerolineales bacterium]|jgi:multiple sugar transport system permease protein